VQLLIVRGINMSYPIIDVSHWDVLGEEHPGYIGEREKEWICDPENGNIAMFKIPREDRGEHWAEKISCELACKLDLPSAKVELAIRNGITGCLSYFFVDKANGYSHYDSGSFFQYFYDENKKIIYKIEIIEQLLQKHNLFEDFLSIVVFDALVANGDRHQDNWGITRHEKSGEIFISPMYDNSACLGRDFTEADIQKYLCSENEILRHLFKGKSKIGTINKKSENHFSLIRYLYKSYPNRVEELLSRIAKLSDNDIEEIVNQLPYNILEENYKKVVINFIKFRREILINIGDNMKNNIIDLLLVWKDPDTRQRFVVGILSHNEKNEEYKYMYVNPEKNAAFSHGFQNFPSFPDLNEVYVIEGEIFPGIKPRLPNRKRENYPEILKKYNLDATSSDMEILAATRGRLGTDSFEFVQSIHFDSEEPFKVTFDLAAARRYDFPEIRLSLSENQSVILIHDYANPVDPFAVKVMYEHFCLGFVPKYYSQEIARMLESGHKYTAKIKTLDINNPNPDEWARIIVEVIHN